MQLQKEIVRDLQTFSVNDLLTMSKVHKIDVSPLTTFLGQIASKNLKTAQMEPANLKRYTTFSKATRNVLAENFDCDKTLGSGTYGVVYKCLADSKPYAVKITKSNDAELPILEYIKEKTASTSGKSHMNLLTLVNSWKTPDNYILQFPVMDYTLSEYIAGVSKMDPLLIKSYMYQLLRAVGYLHSINIIHLDIKPANILIDKGGVLKLADFGLSEKTWETSEIDNVITLPYRPPELLLGDIYKKKVPRNNAMDIWSCGMVMYEMITQKWFGYDIASTPMEYIGLLTVYFGLNGQIQEHTPILDPQFLYIDGKPQATPDQRKFIKRLLEWRASARPTARTALKYEYFKDLGTEFFGSDGFFLS